MSVGIAQRFGKVTAPESSSGRLFQPQKTQYDNRWYSPAVPFWNHFDRMVSISSFFQSHTYTEICRVNRRHKCQAPRSVNIIDATDIRLETVFNDRFGGVDVYNPKGKKG